MTKFIQAASLLNKGSFRSLPPLIGLSSPFSLFSFAQIECEERKESRVEETLSISGVRVY